MTSMGPHEIRSKSPTECFAWHYAFFARLANRKAPGSAAQLLHLTQAVHAFRGHLDPIRVADPGARRLARRAKNA